MFLAPRSEAPALQRVSETDEALATQTGDKQWKIIVFPDEEPSMDSLPEESTNLESTKSERLADESHHPAGTRLANNTAKSASFRWNLGRRCQKYETSFKTSSWPSSASIWSATHRPESSSSHSEFNTAFSMTEDPQDCSALTLGHFLIGNSLLTVARKDATLTTIRRLQTEIFGGLRSVIA